MTAIIGSTIARELVCASRRSRLADSLTYDGWRDNLVVLSTLLAGRRFQSKPILASSLAQTPEHWHYAAGKEGVAGVTIKRDTEVRAGGWAVLELSLAHAPRSVGLHVYYPDDGVFLAENGERSPRPSEFKVDLIWEEGGVARYSLPPNICNFIRDFEVVEIKAADGSFETGEIDWPSNIGTYPSWRAGLPIPNRAELTGSRGPEPKLTDEQSIKGLQAESGNWSKSTEQSEPPPLSVEPPPLPGEPLPQSVHPVPSNSAKAPEGPAPRRRWPLFMAVFSGLAMVVAGMILWLTGSSYSALFCDSFGIGCASNVSYEEERLFAQGYQCWKREHACQSAACFGDLKRTFPNSYLILHADALIREAQSSCIISKHKAFQEAKACIAGSACSAYDCITRFQNSYPNDPRYHSELQSLYEAARSDCDVQGAFAKFEECVDQLALPCKIGKCSRILTSRFRETRYDEQLWRTLEQWAAICIPSPPALPLPDGTYMVTRGWYAADDGGYCKERYDPVTITINGGQITFTSDGSVWAGTVDSQGTLDLTNVHPAPLQPNYRAKVKGHYSKAAMVSMFCGVGWLQLKRVGS